MQDFLKPLFHSQSFDEKNFFLIAGPCVIENKEILEKTASVLAQLCSELQIPLVFKSSYRKANRTSAQSFKGIGDEAGLELLKSIGSQFNLPTITDIHAAQEAEMAAHFVDILQIPAFLCRQTDLLEAAGRTGKIINVKKGQFLSGEAMKFAVDKIKRTGNSKIVLTERGNTFGYQDLVVDYRNIPIMKSLGLPVVMDCTHALQQPNLSSGVTGGNPQLISTIAKAAVAVGADGLFIETHPNPAEALSDGANMLALDKLEGLLRELIKIRKAIA